MKIEGGGVIGKHGAPEEAEDPEPRRRNVPRLMTGQSGERRDASKGFMAGRSDHPFAMASFCFEIRSSAKVWGNRERFRSTEKVCKSNSGK